MCTSYGFADQATPSRIAACCPSFSGQHRIWITYKPMAHPAGEGRSDDAKEMAKPKTAL